MKQPEYEVVEGIVEDLEVFDADVNYLRVKQESHTESMVSALQVVMASSEDEDSAQAASNAGDPVEAFSMRIGELAVQGSFWKTTFKNGDSIKVIGLKGNGVFNAIAVALPEKRIVWMQPHCERGVSAQRRYILRNSIIFVIVIFLISTFLFTEPTMQLWFYMLGASLSSAVILIATVGMSWGDFMTFAHRMTRVASALEIDFPENVDLAKSTKARINDGLPELPMGVYYY